MKFNVMGLLALTLVLPTSAMAVAPAVDLGTLTTAANSTQFIPGGATEIIFDLSQGGDLYGSITNILLNGPGGTPLYNSAGWTANLYQGTPTSGTFLSSVSSSDAFGKVFTGLQSATAYSFQIVGTGTGSLGGGYSLTLVPQSAVPVPGPAGFLVAAVLGAGVGFRSLRQRRAEKRATTV